MNITWQIVRLQLKETFSISYGNYSYRDALIIQLKYNDFSGFGECTAIDYYNINLETFVAKLELIKSQLENHKIVHPTHFYHFLETLQLHSFLRSALDCAYWDLFGKLENKSFLELNQIQFDIIPQSSITISIDSIENQIKKIEASTWQKFKVKCNQFNQSAIIKLSELEQDIALDLNGSFSSENCTWFEKNKWTEKFSYLEQPLKLGKENFQKLNSNLHVNWMADEDCQDSSDLELLKNHYKSINIKLVKCGGLTPALEMIKKARSLDYKIMIGCMTESTIGISAGAVLAPFCDFVDLDGANLIANDIANGSQIINGKIYLSESHGLGIKLF